MYADTSAVRRFDLLEQALRRAGPDKILFGSDGPWLHPGVELAKVRLLGLPPADERKVLGDNFLRLVARGRGRPRPVSAASRAFRRRTVGGGPLGERLSSRSADRCAWPRGAAAAPVP